MKRISLFFFLFLASIILVKNLGIAEGFFDRMDQIPFSDKLGHFFLMGFMVFLVNLSMKCESVKVGNLTIQKGLLWVFPFVMLEEFSQMFMVFRKFSTGDILADILGMLFFSYLAQKVFQNPTLRTAVS